MSWIKIITYDEAKGKLKSLYDRIKGPDNYIDNIMLVHSLRPNTLEGHMALYKNALHHRHNILPKWFLEAIGVYVSLLNGCHYCVQHHFTGMTKLIGDERIADSILKALKADSPDKHFTGKELAILDYTRALTLEPASVKEYDVRQLQEMGIPDGEILEINQVIAYFSYANRTVQGLGVTTDHEILGLSPGSKDADNWQHQ